MFLYNIYILYIYNRNLCHLTTLQYEISSGMNACILELSLFTNSSPTWEAKISESQLMPLKSEQLEYADFSQIIGSALGFDLWFFLSSALEIFQSQRWAGVSWSRYLLLWSLATLVKVFRRSAWGVLHVMNNPTLTPYEYEKNPNHPKAFGGGNSNEGYPQIFVFH